MFFAVLSTLVGHAQCSIITTVAGNGTAGYSGDGGAATAASLKIPAAVAVDGSGNVYVADAFNSRIRKVSAAGIISTIAGTGIAGFSGDGGAATSANLYFPAGIAVDDSGNVYIADRGNAVIRKVSAAGIITTIAGQGFGGDGGLATAAWLSRPHGLAIDGSGNIYIADDIDNRIRKISTSGIITTVAGIGSAGYSGDGSEATAAELNGPTGVTLDLGGNLYIADSWNYCIRKVSTSGIITTIAGTGISGYSGDGSAATMAQFTRPYGVAVDFSGNLYVADSGVASIRKIDLSGTITSFAGNGSRGYSGDGGAATAAQIIGAWGVAVDGSGNLYISDGDNKRIRKVSANTLLGSITGSPSVSVGSSITLTDTTTGGVWSASNTNATVDATTGVVTGVAAGIDTISYTVTNACGSASATYVMTITTPSTPCTIPDAGVISGNTVLAVGATTSLTASMAIGDNYGGGKIAYILQPGDPGYAVDSIKGLIAADSDISTTAPWGCSGVTTGASDASLFSGLSNTVAILSHCTSFGIAAQLCHSYVGGGYNDWYLPSIDELTKLYDNRVVIGGFSTNHYWSSTETGAEYGAWEINFLGGWYVSNRLKTETFQVRAVRSFSTTSLLASTWSSSNPSVATVDASGVVTGVAAGIDTISYTVTNACGSASATYVMTITIPNDTPTFVNGSAYTIPVNVCQNSNGVDLTQYLHVSDTDASQTLTVSLAGIPDRCGSVVVTGGTAASGSADITPSGSIIYTPSIGFTGTEHFEMRVSDGTSFSNIVVAVNVAAVTASVTSQTNVSCNGGNSGAATVVVSGPVGTLTYHWAPGTLTGDGTPTVTDLMAGVYTVTASDGTGCEVTQEVTITEPAVLTASISATTNITCNGLGNGNATVTSAGGTGTFTYSWSPAGGTLATATGLSAGDYTVTVTDANSCTQTATTTITEPAALTASITATTNVSCNAGSNGTATVDVAGGTGAFTYSWSPAGGTLATATGLAAGDYTVTVTDANSCTQTAVATVTEPTVLTANISATTNVSCNGTNDGAATVVATGGTGAFTYSWSPAGGSAATAIGLTAGDYTVTVTDANSCTQKAVATITEPTALTASITATTNVSCNAGSNGTATVDVAGGTGSFTYSWSPAGGTLATATGLSAGDYTVTVTDANSCTQTASTTITEPTALTASITATTNVSCNAGSNGSATVAAAGGTGAFTYSWSPAGGTLATATGLAAGDYTVTVTDANSCTQTASTTITEPTALTASITATTNVSCNGLSDGSATVAATGGTGAFTYSWSPAGGSAATATGLTAGDYTVTVTDANSCTQTAVATVTEPTVLTANISATTNVSCNGTNDGAATVVATGGTGAFTYSWSPAGGSAATAIGLTAGDYTVTVTDANSCTQKAVATITEPAVLNATASMLSAISCNGGNNGAADVAVTGGTTPYTYTWNGAASATSSIGSLSAGAYTVIVTDNHNCADTDAVTITEPTLLTTSVSAQTNVACRGNATGSATIAATGGTGAFTYSWSPAGGNQATATGLTAGDYTVTVADANNCIATQPVTITEPATGIFASVTSQTNVSCNGLSDGSAVIDATSTAMPLSYSWAPAGGTSATGTGLAAGTYSVTISDASSCTYTQTVTITEPTVLTANITATTNVSCNGSSNGAATVTAGGGTTGYTYSWSPAGGTLATATGLSAGDYTVTVTDANSCTQTASTTITEPTALTASITATTNVSCNAGSNGSATVAAAGGTGSFTYSWSPAGGALATATGLAAGDYTVTVTDANSCTQTASTTITEPTALTASITATTNVSCNGLSDGSATVAAAGGTGAFTYSWSPAGGSAATATGLTAGDYTVTVTDANSCTQTAVATVTEPTVLTANISATTNVSCNGTNDGTATVAATGGTGTYDFSWSPAGGTSATATGLSAGSYTVTVTDANSCIQKAIATITEPAVLNATASMQSAVSCNGGNNGVADVAVTGGTAPYTYTWNSAASATSSIGGLSAGAYTVIVTDNHNCADTDAVTITEPTLLTASVSAQTNVACRGNATGSATIAATGGTGGFTYSWSPAGGNLATATGLTAGDYTVTVTDANNCTATQPVTITEPATGIFASVTSQTNVSCNGLSDGSAVIDATSTAMPLSYSWAPAGGTSATGTGLAAGTYSVTISDASSCTYTQTVTITEPTVLTANITATTNVSCNGSSNGAATVTAGGGTTGYTYSWSPAGGTLATATGLSAGDYTVTVTDANSCTQTASTTITEPTALTASITATTNVSCNAGSNGSATVAAAGGTGAFTYSWSPAGGTLATATGLAAGDYTVTVTDANSCTQTASTTITEPTSLTASITATTNVSCNGLSDGSATVAAAGGTGTYTYSWSPAGGTLATATGLTAGNYTVIVTDANNCTQTTSTAVTEPTVLTASVTATTDVSCNGGSNGTAKVTTAGGTTPYTYSWSPAGGALATGTGLTAGNYTVTITDANSCTQTAFATIAEPTVLTASITATTDVSCFGGNNGAATVTAGGGTAPYTYSWSSLTATTDTVSGLTANIYTATVTDAHGCIQTAVATITQPATYPSIATIANNGPICSGTTLSLTSLAAGGVAPYTFSWSGPAGFTSTDANPSVSSAPVTASGVYSLTVTDAHACVIADTMSVLVKDLPVIVSSGSNSPVCAGVTLSLNVTATATGAIDYSWTGSDGFTSTEQNPGVNTTTMSGVYTYTVMATGNGGCNSQAVFTATVNPLPHAVAPADMAICNGASTTLISFGSDVPGTTFDWANTNTSIGLAATGTGDIAAFTAVNAGTDPVVATIVVTPTANGCVGTNDTMLITVNPTPQLTSTLAPAAICDSTTFTYTPTSLTAGTTYVWSRDVVTGISNAANADNTDPAEVLDNTTPNPVAVTYVYTLTANGCTNTQSVVVTVNPTPMLTSTLTAAPVCNSTLFSYTPTSATAGTTFSWTRDTMANILNATAAGTNDPMETLVNVAPYPVNVAYVYTLTANGCSHTETVQMTVNPTPQLSSTLVPASICDSALFSYVPTSLTSGTTFSWSRATVTGIHNPAGAGTDNPMETLYNTTADSIAVDYIYTLTAYGCSNTQAVRVYVKPTPKLSSTLTPAAICNNTVFNYTPASATGGTSFTWSRALAVGISNPANAGSGNPMEVLNNNTANQVSTRYVFTLNAAGCIHSQVVTAKVNATPALSGTTVGTICSGAPFFYMPGSATVGTSFTWSRATAPGISNTAATGVDSIAETLYNLTNATKYVTYRYTLVANGCSNIQNVVIGVNPTPVTAHIATHPDATLCSQTMYQNFGADVPAPDSAYYTWTAINAEVYAQGAGHTNALVSFPNSGPAAVVLIAGVDGYICNAYDTFLVNVSTSVAPNADVFYVHDHFFYTDNTVSTYQWGYDDATSLDSLILTGQVDQNYFDASPDFTNKKYWVMTTKDGCMSKSYYNAPAGVVNVNNTVVVNLTVAPNPASNSVVVTATGIANGNDKVELADMTGKVVLTAATLNNKALLNVADLASGVYVVTYYHNGIKAGSSKLVKE